jgi:cobaltochelatase CobT
MEWSDWVVLVLSLAFLALYGREIWRSAWENRPALGFLALHGGRSAREFWRSARENGPVQFDPTRPYAVYCRDFDVEVVVDKLDETLDLTSNSVSPGRLLDLETDLAAWRQRHGAAVLETAARIRAAAGQDALDDTIVSFLVDHSGSMRTKPVALAAKVVLAACELLEALHAKQEVLGFTTVRWRGGLSRQKWLEAGRPPYPGRLNDVLHIVYCSVGERPGLRRCAMMMREEILKENLDGEAVQWAASRLRRCAEGRKNLIVISDGAPVDDSTLAANGAPYLENHLRSVMQEIAQAGDIQIAAIGVGHDVGRYYERSVTVTDLDDDATRAIQELLEQLLCPPRADAEAVDP